MHSDASENLLATLSEGERAAIDAELAHLPYRSAAAIDALRIVQAQRGWISDDSLRAVARYLGMAADELEGIATFYNLIFRRPVGEHVILLCNSVSCWIEGCDRIREGIGSRLGIAPGETSADGRFTLLPVPCLGACDRAPVLMLDDELHTRVDDAALEQLLAGEDGDDA
ncbi:MAG: NADH-quinone oxidoreductase subunit NuoE [Chromatocurvus sp.]